MGTDWVLGSPSQSSLINIQTGLDPSRLERLEKLWDVKNVMMASNISKERVVSHAFFCPNIERERIKA